MPVYHRLIMDGQELAKGNLDLHITMRLNSTNQQLKLYLDRGKESEGVNKSIFDSLYENKAEIDEDFGGELEGNGDNKRACRGTGGY